MQPTPANKSPMGTLCLTLGILALCIGAALVILAMGHDPNAAPSCDGETMSPGDRCMAIGGGAGGGDYEEMQAQANEQSDQHALVGRITLAGASVVTLLGIVLQIRARAAVRAARRAIPTR